MLSAFLVQYENHPFQTRFVGYDRADANFSDSTITGRKEKIPFTVPFYVTLNTQRLFPNPCDGLFGFPHTLTYPYGGWKTISTRTGC